MGLPLVLSVAVLSLQLGGPFGDAQASVVESDDTTMTIELQVEIGVSADAVVAHLALPGEESVTLPMLQRRPGVYGVQVELRPGDYQVVFEILGPSAVTSEPVSLTELGAILDIGEPAPAPPTTGELLSPAVTRWGWLAAALAAASLSALAFWVLGGTETAGEGGISPPVELPPSRPSADPPPPAGQETVES